MPPCPQCNSTASRGPVKQIQQWSPPVSEPEPEPPSADPASLLDSLNATAPPPPLPAPPPPRRGAPPNSAASAPRDESGWSSIEIAIWPDEIATSFESSPHEAESSGAEAEAEAEAAEAGMAEAVAAAAASADSAESGAAGRGGSGGGGGGSGGVDWANGFGGGLGAALCLSVRLPLRRVRQGLRVDR
mmetsp:Transcript_31096/g.91174  ORF Transcript_31096/g.91174 Transcript_31096/m.91174 type:complete len:188 (+) Transcript_31096:666-1229(+)